MEAWIEIVVSTSGHPTTSVASFVEAWIEIYSLGNGVFFNDVASFVEAWIEIGERIARKTGSGSPPLWRRGLK